MQCGLSFHCRLTASGQRTGEAALVQVFDLVKKVWVGQPIPVPRPFGINSGTVAATARAVLPNGGLAMSPNRGDLLAIQPQQIQAEACQKLKPLLRGFGLQGIRSGIPPGVARLTREACTYFRQLVLRIHTTVHFSIQQRKE
jgi:hypothetical protein